MSADENYTVRGEPIVGNRYRVVMDDCCVEGWFEGAYVGPEFKPDPIDGEPYQVGLRFSSAVIGPVDSSAWHLEHARHDGGKVPCPECGTTVVRFVSFGGNGGSVVTVVCDNGHHRAPWSDPTQRG